MAHHEWSYDIPPVEVPPLFTVGELSLCTDSAADHQAVVERIKADAEDPAIREMHRAVAERIDLERLPAEREALQAFLNNISKS
ncbi:MAG TPA: hypothetical protein VHT70_04230 [Candidatus Saccharimonadales bacterium]|jgi:hypothetical protein|nr:hypothetical protein [Candidatus Saccharimonadales bacterium]